MSDDVIIKFLFCVYIVTAGGIYPDFALYRMSLSKYRGENDLRTLFKWQDHHLPLFFWGILSAWGFFCLLRNAVATSETPEEVVDELATKQYTLSTQRDRRSLKTKLVRLRFTDLHKPSLWVTHDKKEL